MDRWRAEFPILDTCTYLVSHSLGAMPTRARAYLQQFADEWDTRGVRAWHEGWWDIGRETGNLLAPILANSLSGTFAAFYSEFPSINAACPPWVFHVVLASSCLGGAAGAAYAVLQLPIRYWRRIAAGVAAFILAYLISGVLFVASTSLVSSALRRISATGA